MRFTIFIITLILTTVSNRTMAVETGVNPQAMFYISIPFDNTMSASDKTTFGFRLDSHAYSRFDNVPYIRQLDRHAVFDFKMTSKDIEGIYFSGIDYYQIYKVNRQNEDGDQSSDEIGVTDEVRGILLDMTSKAPMGVWIGIGLGIGLLMGSSK